MKSKELRSYNLPEDKPVLAQIDAKPKGLFVSMIFLGLLSLTINTSFFYGILLIVFTLFMVLFLPNTTMIQFYDMYLVLFNKADRSFCQILYYDEIASWYYSLGANKDFLIIEMVDGQTYGIEAFSKRVFEHNMNLFLKEKKRKNK